MIEYLTTFHGATLNRLLQAVLEDLQPPYSVSGCKALGIIDKLVTVPFWRYLQSSSVSFLKMSDIYTKMRDCFERWCNNAQSVFEIFFPDRTSLHDDVVACLCELTENDHLVENCSNCYSRASPSQLRGCLSIIYPLENTTMYLIFILYHVSAQDQCYS